MVMQPGAASTTNQQSAQPEQPCQAAVYRHYLQLQSIAAQSFSGSLAGRLLFCLGFGPQGAELALATTIAGGAFWAVEADPDRLKAAIRNGSCDFMVNTLDEALRVLKNQLRKQAPLSAGLLGNTEEILAAMVERGVQPDLIADSTPAEPHPTAAEAIATLLQRGAHPFPFESVVEQDKQTPHSFNEVRWQAASRQDLSRMDKIALEWLPPEDITRRRWLEQAPAYFYRQLPLERVLSLSPEEHTQLAQAFHSAGYPTSRF